MMFQLIRTNSIPNTASVSSSHVAKRSKLSTNLSFASDVCEPPSSAPVSDPADAIDISDDEGENPQNDPEKELGKQALIISSS
jgi:hypothetical protein